MPDPQLEAASDPRAWRSGAGGGQNLLTSGASWALQLLSAWDGKAPWQTASGMKDNTPPCPPSACGLEVPAAGLTHQLRRPGLGSWSVGRLVRSASAHGGPEGPLWGRALGTPAGQRWRSFPPTRGPYRPGPLEKGAAWFSLGKTKQSRCSHPHGVEVLARPPRCPWPGLLGVLPHSRPQSRLPAVGYGVTLPPCPSFLPQALGPPPPGRFWTMQPYPGSPS